MGSLYLHRPMFNIFKRLGTTTYPHKILLYIKHLTHCLFTQIGSTNLHGMLGTAQLSSSEVAFQSRKWLLGIPPPLPNLRTKAHFLGKTWIYTWICWHNANAGAAELTGDDQWLGNVGVLKSSASVPCRPFSSQADQFESWAIKTTLTGLGILPYSPVLLSSIYWHLHKCHKGNTGWARIPYASLQHCLTYYGSKRAIFQEAQKTN